MLTDWGATPARHWRNYGDDPLPTPEEALSEPFAAFPSWFLRIECERCGKTRMINSIYAPWRDRTLRDILAHARHADYGGMPVRVRRSAPHGSAGLAAVR